MADRKGRLEDRPDRIEAELFPFKFQKVDIEKILGALEDAGEQFIFRYEVNKKRYIQIINFEKHQYPHIREPKSTIPAPDEHSAKTRPARLNPESPILNPESLYSPKGEGVVSEQKIKTETEIQRIVKGWKLLNEIPVEGAESVQWDKVHFPRHAKSAKSLLSLFGYEGAILCMEHVFWEMKNKKLSCTIETVVKHSDLWREQAAKVGR